MPAGMTPSSDDSLARIGTNRYAYSANDPVNKADPNGHVLEGGTGDEPEAFVPKPVPPPGSGSIKMPPKVAPAPTMPSGESFEKITEGTDSVAGPANAVVGIMIQGEDITNGLAIDPNDPMKVGNIPNICACFRGGGGPKACRGGPTSSGSYRGW